MTFSPILPDSSTGPRHAREDAAGHTSPVTLRKARRRLGRAPRAWMAPDAGTKVWAPDLVRRLDSPSRRCPSVTTRARTAPGPVRISDLAHLRSDRSLTIIPIPLLWPTF